MHAAGHDLEGVRLRGVIVVLWRAALRISEALALNETDSILSEELCSFATARAISGVRSEWTAGHGPTSNHGSACAPVCRSDGCSPSSADQRAGGRARRPVSASNCTTPRSAAGVRRRFAPHQLRHAHAVEMSREGISLIVIQGQLGHADLAITSDTYAASTTPRSSKPSMNGQNR
jgi:site-specific recombinase XerD